MDKESDQDATLTQVASNLIDQYFQQLHNDDVGKTDIIEVIFAVLEKEQIDTQLTLKSALDKNDLITLAGVLISFLNQKFDNKFQSKKQLIAPQKVISLHKCAYSLFNSLFKDHSEIFINSDSQTKKIELTKELDNQKDVQTTENINIVKIMNGFLFARIQYDQYNKKQQIQIHQQIHDQHLQKIRLGSLASLLRALPPHIDENKKIDKSFKKHKIEKDIENIDNTDDESINSVWLVEMFISLFIKEVILASKAPNAKAREKTNTILNLLTSKILLLNTKSNQQQIQQQKQNSSQSTSFANQINSGLNSNSNQLTFRSLISIILSGIAIPPKLEDIIDQEDALRLQIDNDLDQNDDDDEVSIANDNIHDIDEDKQIIKDIADDEDEDDVMKLRSKRDQSNKKKKFEKGGKSIVSKKQQEKMNQKEVKKESLKLKDEKKTKIKQKSLEKAKQMNEQAKQKQKQAKIQQKLLERKHMKDLFSGSISCLCTLISNHPAEFNKLCIKDVEELVSFKTSSFTDQTIKPHSYSDLFALPPFIIKPLAHNPILQVIINQNQQQTFSSSSSSSLVNQITPSIFQSSINQSEQLDQHPLILLIQSLCCPPPHELDNDGLQSVFVLLNTIVAHSPQLLQKPSTQIINQTQGTLQRSNSRVSLSTSSNSSKYPQSKITSQTPLYGLILQHFFAIKPDKRGPIRASLTLFVAKCLRKYSYASVERHIPESDHKLLTRLRKAREKKMASADTNKENITQKLAKRTTSGAGFGQNRSPSERLGQLSIGQMLVRAGNEQKKERNKQKKEEDENNEIGLNIRDGELIQAESELEDEEEKDFLIERGLIDKSSQQQNQSKRQMQKQKRRKDDEKKKINDEKQNKHQQKMEKDAISLPVDKISGKLIIVDEENEKSKEIERKRALKLKSKQEILARQLLSGKLNQGSELTNRVKQLGILKDTDINSVGNESLKLGMPINAADAMRQLKVKSQRKKEMNKSKNNRDFGSDEKSSSENDDQNNKGNNWRQNLTGLLLDKPNKRKRDQFDAEVDDDDEDNQFDKRSIKSRRNKGNSLIDKDQPRDNDNNSMSDELDDFSGNSTNRAVNVKPRRETQGKQLHKQMSKFGQESKTSQGGKGKVEPYAYMQLNPATINRRNQMQTEKGFKDVMDNLSHKRKRLRTASEPRQDRSESKPKVNPFATFRQGKSIKQSLTRSQKKAKSKHK